MKKELIKFIVSVEKMVRSHVEGKIIGIEYSGAGVDSSLDTKLKYNYDQLSVNTEVTEYESYDRLSDGNYILLDIKVTTLKT